MISVLYADPPWTYNDKLRMDDVKRSSDDHYPTLDAMGVRMFLHMNGPHGSVRDEDGWPHPAFKDVLADDAILFLWATNPFILDGEAQAVCKSWGFEPKQMIPWIKGRLTYDIQQLDACQVQVNPRMVLHTGMGFYTRGVSEHLIVATRGQATSLIKNRGVNGLIVAPEEAFILAPRGAHSEKPEEAYQLIERLCGPGTELFARRRRTGWEQYGDQLPKE